MEALLTSDKNSLFMHQCCTLKVSAGYHQQHTNYNLKEIKGISEHCAALISSLGIDDEMDLSLPCGQCYL